jgi:glutamyl-tRNA synthetase/glutamyl-Q tRNA(Asp) synthetase
MSEERCRFAPTTSGPAHPGTLLAALLCWLDARSRGARLSLRLEDIDSTRCTPESADDMLSALEWFALDWDEVSMQSANSSSHEAALDELARNGLLYPCACSRSEIKRSSERAADGGWRYSGSCRNRPLPKGGWRSVQEALRLRLRSERVEPHDEAGVDLAQDPAAEMGDPVLLGRTGSIAYHLASVVDDGLQQITRVVRGRDLAASTAIHVTLQRLLGFSTPIYRHHFLLLEESGGKLAKLHGAVGWRELREHYAPEALCGLLAAVAGLIETAAPIRPSELLAAFDWGRVRGADLLMRWTGERLVNSA